MDVRAVSRYVRMSPGKARDLARAIRGASVPEALRIVSFSERKAARLIGETLRSAVANAENNARLAGDDLRVKDAVVDPGPSLRRHWARARGMVSPIRRPTCHVTIVLTDERAGGEAR